MKNASGTNQNLSIDENITYLEKVTKHALEATSPLHTIELLCNFIQ